MKILIAEDDFASRKYIFKFLSNFGKCDVTVDGLEAVDAFLMEMDENGGYDLVCLDVMMPELDGYEVLKAIRDIESQKGINEENAVKVIMTTALNEGKDVSRAFGYGCDAYVGKPIDQIKFINVLEKIGLIT